MDKLDEVADEDARPLEARAGRPALYVTYGLLSLIAAVYAAEYIFRVDGESGFVSPSIRTLIALGALDKNLVTEGGEWWRLFSAPLMHGGLIHIGLNGLGLYFAGAVLENIVGRSWFAAIFAVTALSGALLSLALNPSTLISVGASGAIMGLFAAAFAVSYRYPKGSPVRSFLQSGSLRVLIPSLIPLADGLFGQKIDFAAHLGGALGGGALGVTLMALWPREKRFPSFGRLGWVLAAAGLCGALYSGLQIARTHEDYALASYLIPPGEVPNAVSDAKKKSGDLIAAYPNDPRSHMYRAMVLSDEGDGAGAEREWRAALAQDKVLRSFFKPELAQLIQGYLALQLKENGKEAEAKGFARPVCGATGEIRNELQKERLCP